MLHWNKLKQAANLNPKSWESNCPMLPIRYMPSQRCHIQNHTTNSQRTIDHNTVGLIARETYPLWFPLTTVPNVVSLLTTPDTSRNERAKNTPMSPTTPPTTFASLSIFWLNSRHRNLLGCFCICMNLIVSPLLFLGCHLHLSLPDFLHRTGKSLMNRDTHVLLDLLPQHVIVASYPHFLWSRILIENITLSLSFPSSLSKLRGDISNHLYSLLKC